ncbi:MAG TPA: rhomboid family intramembrane serine protease [Actinomycetota bacterium]
MEQGPLPPPPPSVVEACYRHPKVQTGVHCTRCGRPICPDCMVPAPVGHQCPDCVREARQEFHRPTRRVATGAATGFSITNAILVLLGAVYLLEVISSGAAGIFAGPNGQQLIDLGANIGLGVFPNGEIVGVAAGQEWRLLTSMFLHGGLIHLLMNGYILYIFGNVIEQELGRARFVAIFLVTGLFASAASYAFAGFDGMSTPSVGASGAIFGLFGAFLAYNWRRRELAFYAARVRSALTLIILNLVFTFALSSVIDWRAHVGGLVAGLVAGFAAEGAGSARSRTWIFAATVVALLVVTAGITMWRTDQIRALAGPLL